MWLPVQSIMVLPVMTTGASSMPPQVDLSYATARTVRVTRAAAGRQVLRAPHRVGPARPFAPCKGQRNETSAVTKSVDETTQSVDEFEVIDDEKLELAMTDDDRNSLEVQIESALFNFRFLSIFGVVGCLLSSVTMYIYGITAVLEASEGAFVSISPDVISHFLESQLGWESIRGDRVSSLIVESMDNFMLATVLLVFGLGLYELFISEIDDEVLAAQNGFSIGPRGPPVVRPAWLKTKGLDDLKIKLGKVVVMIFLVKTLGFLQDVEVKTPDDLLTSSLAILASSVSLFLAGLGINPWQNKKAD